MPVRVQCPNEQCRASYSVSDADLGRSGKCKKCGTKFELYPTLDPADGPPNSWASSGSGSGGGADAPLPSELEVGSLFGRYRVERPLGRGGMGAVYLAHDSQLDRPVALKVPHFTAGDGPEVIERFYREAKAAAGFDHPNLCPVYDVGQVNGTYYLTMPYIEGRPLSALISDGPLDPRRAAELVQKLAMALAEAHNRGVIHRDLKPSNVMVHPRRGVVVMDFGLARRAFTEDMRLTKTGSILGTPAYMSPEQVNGDVHAMGPGCDIYSLGVILYELLTGRLPFEGSMAAVLGQIMVKDPAPPTALRPGLDRRLEAICLKAMNKKPADRFGSMEAMAASLGAVLRSPSPTVVERPAPPKPKIPGSSVEVDVIDAEVIEEAPPPPRPRTPTPKPKPAARPEPHPLDSGPAPAPYRPRPSATRPQPQPQPDQPPPRRPPIGLIAALAGGAAALLVLLGVVIYIATDNGTVKITVADAAKTAIHVDGQEITVVAPETTVKLRTGDHRLMVTYGNTVVEAPKTFTIKRGDETVLTIEYPVAGPVGGAGAGGVAVGGVNSIGLTMVPIAAGEFTMGSPDSDSDAGPDERPAHRVRIGNGFALGRTEVTQAQFRQVMGTNPSTTIGDDLPVHNVTWVEAVEFCNKLSGAEGLPPYYDLTASPVAVRGGAGYRLPTEAEWEYACRAGTTARYSFGDDVGVLGIYAWFDGNSNGQPHPVGQKQANPWGLHDMHGNVWEWCWDWYDGSTYSNTGDLDPTGPYQTSGSRVIRGGSHSYSGAFHRSAYRNLDLPEQRFAIDGFRVARSADGRGPVPAAGGVGSIPAPPAVAPAAPGGAAGIRLANVPAGTFWMGSTDDDTMADRDEKPRRRVTITRPFAIGVYEITRAEYRRVIGRDPSQLPGSDTHPVDSVSWVDALAFCNALSAAEGLPPYYTINGDSSTINGGGGYRLPTEAEWEYACRAGTDTRYGYGDDASQLGNYGWYSDNSGGATHPVGLKLPNPWGLYDVHGNANEWVWDRHGDPTGPADLVDPLGPPDGSMHVVRGGYYDNSFAALRSAYRYLEEPAKILPRYGLRLVRTLDGAGAVAPPAAAPVAAAPAGATSNSLGMALVKISDAPFMMGAVDSDPDGGDDEKPRRQVFFTAPYSLGTTEVTQAQFRRIMGSNPSTTIGDDLPVHGLTWFEAIDFCNKLSAAEGLPAYYSVVGGRATINGGNGYRLPTEAEWEKACRAGSDGRFCYGDDASGLGQYAWYSENASGGPQRVAQKQPNAFGLYDMHGNVWEWCWDWYDGSYYGRARAIDPTGPEEERSSRVIRGGSYQSAPSSARSSYRNLDVPDGRFIINGFRVARTAS